MADHTTGRSMGKRLLFATAAVIALLQAAAFFYTHRNGVPAGTGGSVLTIYPASRDELLNATIPLFEEKYKIQVVLVKGETVDLLEKIRTGSGDPPADVLLGGVYSELYSYADLFLDYVSVNDKHLIPAYQNATGYTTSYILSGSCLVVNKSLTQGVEIKGYKDLLKPELDGKIIMANPINSSSALAQLTNILLAMGGYEDDGAWAYVDELIGHTGEIASTSSKVYSSVASGKKAVGLSYEAPCAALMRSGADIEIVYPEEGCVYLPATAAIVRGGRQPEYARHFIDFITSKDMQNIYGNLLMNRSVRKDALSGAYLVPLDRIDMLEEDMDYVKKHKLDILSRYSNIVSEHTGD